MKVYVSPEGSEGGAGTLDDPLGNLEQARDVVRAYLRREGSGSGSITVYFREGTYTVEEPVTFTEEDAATQGGRIVYRAYPGEDAVFSGGISLPASVFTPLRGDDPRAGSIIDEEARANVVHVDLKELGISEYGERSYHGFRVGTGLTPPMELFINGRAMIPARWPNEGYAPMDGSVPLEERIIEPGDDWSEQNPQGPGGTFRVDFDRLKQWENAEDMWLDGLVANDWSWQSHRIAAIDPEKQTISLANPAPYTIKATPRFFVENLLEEVDMPGEYFIDRATGYLYLYPPEDMGEGAAVSVSTLSEPMLVIDGAARLTFMGFIFDTGRGGALEVLSGEANRFREIEIRNFTGTAIKLYGRNNGVMYADIHDIGGAGLILGGGDRETLQKGHNFVEDTRIYRFANYDKAYIPGVKLEGVGNRVSHCEIYDGPHGGITIQGNDHLIEYNNLHHLIQDFSDFGAIYAAIGQNPLQRGTIIRRNFIHSLGKPGTKWCVGIYSDWFSQGFTIEENILYRIGEDADMFEFIGIVNSSGRYNKILNNIFIECRIPYDRGYNMSYGYKKSGKDKPLLEAWKKILGEPSVVERGVLELEGVEWEENQGEPSVVDGIYGTRYPELHRFFDEAIWFPTTCRFERNLIYNKQLPLHPEYLPEHFVMDRTSKGWSNHEDLANARDNLVTDVDPGFVNLAERNFKIREEARVFDEIPGFRSIPFEEIGVRE
jgi:hypothetical protein